MEEKTCRTWKGVIRTLKPSIVFPAITFAVLVVPFGLSIFEVYEVSDTEIEFVIILVVLLEWADCTRRQLEKDSQNSNKSKRKNPFSNFFCIYFIFASNNMRNLSYT